MCLYNMESAIYQSILSFAICDMMIIAILLLFCLRYYSAEQNKLILFGQAGILFVLQIMISGKQGEMMKRDLVVVGSIWTFFLIVIAIVGVFS